MLGEVSRMLSKRFFAILSVVIIVAGCGELAAQNGAGDREERSRDNDNQGKRDVGEHFARIALHHGYHRIRCTQINPDYL